MKIFLESSIHNSQYQRKINIQLKIRIMIYEYFNNIHLIDTSFDFL